MEFVDRNAELSRLTKLYNSDQAELAVIYGRRRLGKTALVRQSLTDYEDAILFQAKQKTKELQIREFIDTAEESFPGISRIRENWDSLIGYLADQDAIVVLDEFPYLIEEEPSLPSVIQELYDYGVDESALTLVLVGSSISMMEDAALLGNSPLYGRCSEKLDITELPFNAAMSLYPDSYSPSEQILLWAVFGGTPYYIEEAATYNTISDAIEQTLLSSHSALHNDPDYVLRMELSEPTRYFSILEAIAGGNTSLNEIAQASGVDSDQISRYIDRLKRLRLVEREVPITERPEKSRRGQYRIVDSMFEFWFRFLYGTPIQYDQLTPGAYDTVVEPKMNDFASGTFETLAQHALRELYPSYTITRTGRWWYQNHEIDVVGITNSDVLLVGECKFQNSPVGYDVLSTLESHESELRWNPEQGGERKCEYAVFSKSGFTNSLREIATERDDVSLFTAEDVVNAL
ncbi:ATP-binding protein [Haloprofundus halophilus]|uniref:ATP-binding protein n=1 Tax=Haloprofundus halophilus TaxID=2283527 RepID=UPI000E442516|nr:ATP-binding protein [Haloprofundus halophilus]